jgi:hypothetical protein
MRKLMLLLLVIPSIVVKAQSIKGIVYLSQEKSPAQFSQVALLHLPDSAIVSNTSTKADGSFLFTGVKTGNYFVKASYLGCKPGGKTTSIAPGSAMVQMDTISLVPSSTQLSEVKVTGEKIKATELVDRTVYTIPEDLSKSSLNGYEVLRKIPGVQVDFNNNVTLNGKTNFIIQVDGKQRDQQYLARLLPSDIKSIEVINNPSGKYDGSIDGVINIILKKEARVGMNGNVSTMVRASDKPTGFGSGSLEYGFGKISVYLSGYSFFQRLQNNSGSYYSQKTFTKDQPSVMYDSITNMSGTGKFKITASSINTGFDYYLNDKNNLSFNFSFKPSNVNNDINNIGPISAINDYVFNSPTNTSTNSKESSSSLFYKRTFAKPIKELTAEATFYTFNSTEDNRYISEILKVGQSDPFDTNNRHENKTNDRNYFSGKVDYVMPVGFSARIETGYQFYYQGMNYKNLSTSDTLNLFQYSELRNAAYAGFILNAGKFGFQGTFRGEYSLNSINDTMNSNYFVALPSANIQFKISSKQNIKLSYNRRINRPGIYDLNPFVSVAITKFETTGNPYLKPEYRDRLQLTYTLNLGSNFISPGLYYEYISQKIGNISYMAPSSITKLPVLHTKPENVQSGYERGFNINAMLFFFNINARLFQGHSDKYSYFNGSGSDTLKSQNYSSYSITSYAFKQFFNKKLTAFIFLSYNGVNVNGYTKTYSNPMYGLGAQRVAGNHTFGMFYFLPFKKNFEMSRSVTEMPGFYNKTISSFDVSYYIQVMYSYKFNKGKAVKKLNRKVEVESDTKGGGIRN